MNTQLTVSPVRRARGVSAVPILIAIVLALALAAAVWFLILEPHHAAKTANAPAAQPAATATASAPPPADVSAMSNAELLSEASKAIKDQRLLAPAGNNAFEFYLKVLDRQPNNQVARDALRETFPFAANAAEQVINEGNFAEANREIALLSKADPDNYTLTILRSKLDARRKVKAQQAHDQELAEQRRQAADQAAAHQPGQEQPTTASQLAAEQQAAAEAAVRQQQQASAPAKPPRQQQQQLSSQPKQQTAARPKVTIQNAVLVRKVQPRYPVQAARMRRQGWVEVQFTVGTDGKVRDASVVGASPAHVFDHAALSAVRRWEFKPALRNGTPMAVTMRKRIEFTLGSG
jgi:protein TonB